MARPAFVCLENVDEIVSSDHMPILKAFVKWAGYRLQWSVVHDMSSLSPAHRRRWLAVMVRNDLSRESLCVLPGNLLAFPKDAWNDEKYEFPLPASLSSQLIIPEELYHAYGVVDFLPPAKVSDLPDHPSFQDVLKSRCTAVDDDLPTLVANYSAQHLLPIEFVKKAGLYADLVTDDGVTFRFQPPTRWASLLGNLHAIHWPQAVRDIFHQLGNSVSVPHAAVCLLVALQEIDIHDRYFDVTKIVEAVWKTRMTSDAAVCVENTQGYSLLSVHDLFNYYVIRNGISCFHAAHDILIQWEDGIVTTCQFPSGAEAFRVPMCIGIPSHLIAKFGVMIADGTIYSGDSILPEGTHCVKIVFLPAFSHGPLRQYGQPAISATLPWELNEGDDDGSPGLASPVRRVSQRRTPLCPVVVTLPSGVDMDMMVPDYFCLQQVMKQCGLNDDDLDAIQVLQGNDSCDLQDCIADYPDAHFTVVCNAERPEVTRMSHRIIEVIKPTGMTMFLDCNNTVTISERLLEEGFPDELVQSLRATQNGKMIPMTSRMWDCNLTPLRLRCFPLRGGGPPSQGKGKSKNEVDTLQHQDPWAGSKLPQPKIGARWEHLQLVPNHPFFEKATGQRLKQVSVMQLGPQQAGIAFTTKTGLFAIQAVAEKGTTVILLPASKGIGELRMNEKFVPLKPQQILVKDSTNDAPYMRVVLPVLLKGELDFKIHEPDNIINVDAAQYCEMVIEAHSLLISQATHAAMTEHPLEAFKRVVAAVGISMAEVAIYSYKKIAAQDGHLTHQAILKIPEGYLVTMLNASGKTELFTRQYVHQDSKLCHSVIPRFWPISQEDLRKILQLGQSLEDGFRGIALSKRGLAIRCDNKIIGRARSIIMQGDSRFSELNKDIVVRVMYLAHGFPFQMSHQAIIESTKQGAGCAPVPIRSFRMAGILTWILGFDDHPQSLQFVIKVDKGVHEILLTVQDSNKPAKQVRKQQNTKKNSKHETMDTPSAPSQHVPLQQAPVFHQNDSRITALEKKVANLEVNQSRLADKMDSRFDQMATQLQQVLTAVSVPQQSGRPRESPCFQLEQTMLLSNLGHMSLAVCKLFCFAPRGFDHTMGFPGEGPPWHLATINVGSLEKHKDAMIRGFHCTAYQETRITDCNKKHLSFSAADKGLHLECGPTMKYLSHGKAEWGGVAFTVEPGTGLPYSVDDDCTGNYASMLATNRAMGMWVATEDGTTVLVFNLYLLSGAPSDTDKHCRNDALIQLTLEVIAQHGAIPAIITADFQDMPHCYPALRDAFTAGLWHDLLIQQDGSDNISRPTTFARDKHWQNLEFSSSIDGILVNQHALPFVSSVEVKHALGLQHAFVIASFEFGNMNDRHRGFVWHPHAALDVTNLINEDGRNDLAERLWNDKFYALTENATDSEQLLKVAATQSLYSAALRSDRKDLSIGCSGTIDCEVAPPGSRFQPWRKLDGYEPALIPGAMTGASPTADRLVHSGQTESHLCRWCHKEKETMAHLAGNCEEVVRILGRPFLPMQDQPNLATHGIFEVPPCLLQSKNEWDGRDLPPLEVSESRITIWGDGSCINPEHFFTRTLGFAIVDCQGLLIYKFGQHDPLASSYKAELFALVAAVKTRGALLCYVTDCKSLKDTFEMVRDLGYIPANLPFAKWWNDVFNAAGFKEQCVLQMQWIKAHQFDANYGVIAPLFRNNKIADNYAHAAALESCPVAPQSFRTWRCLVVTHQAWLCKLLKLIASQKDQQREQTETHEIDDDDAADVSESVQLRNRFCNWDWTVPIEHYDWTCTNEPDPAPPSHWRFGLRAWSAWLGIAHGVSSEADCYGGTSQRMLQG
eukprot:Skav208662  [mRNA]  locus=scaffold3341:47701:58414:- [translate_table: standard]